MRCKPKNRASCCQIRTRMMAEAAAVAAWVELTVSKMSRVGWGGMVARPCQCGLVNVCSWGAAPRALTFEWRRGGQKPPSNIVAVEKKSGRFVGAKPPQRNPVLGPLGRGLDYSLISPTSAIQGCFLKVSKSAKRAPIEQHRLGRQWGERCASAGGCPRP